MAHTLARNTQAQFEYEILKTYEAGIALRGFEAKAVQASRVHLAGSFVVVRGGEAFLLGATISPYQPKNTPPGYEPDRTRRLLLHRAELKELIGASAQKHLTLIPVRMYTKGPRIKLEVGLARRRKKYDKREAIKKRDMEREAERTL